MPYYRHTYTAIVLSESDEEDSIAGLPYNVNVGEDCLVSFERTAIEELTPKQAADALRAAGSEPEFFQLDAAGNDIEI